MVPVVKALCWFLVAILAGCASIAETPTERLLGADLTFASVVRELRSLREAGVIEAEPWAEQFRPMIELGNTAIDGARQNVVVDPPAFDSLLDDLNFYVQELTRRRTALGTTVSL